MTPKVIVNEVDVSSTVPLIETDVGQILWGNTHEMKSAVSALRDFSVGVEVKSILEQVEDVWTPPAGPDVGRIKEDMIVIVPATYKHGKMQKRRGVSGKVFNHHKKREKRYGFQGVTIQSISDVETNAELAEVAITMEYENVSES